LTELHPAPLQNQPNQLQVQPSSRRLRFYLIGYAVATALIFVLPRPFPTLILLGMILASALILASNARFPKIAVEINLPTVAFPIRVAVEVLVITVAIFYFVPYLRDWSPFIRIRGTEFSYLINSGVIAANVFERSGSIPLWNPFMGTGEPLLENPFSFVLNPLMTLPIFALGAIQGTKMAVVIHVFLMGMGGWMLGYVLGCKAPARLLLGVLLGSSGSMTAAIGTGFYQMSLSQVYVPWVFAGLFGTLLRRERLWVGLLAVSAMLMIFAGTYWYVLPTALSALGIVIFHLFWRNDQGRWRLNITALKRLLLALGLTAGLSAVRLLPQFVHFEYIDHPRAMLLGDVVDFNLLSPLYFQTTLPAPINNPIIYYHYILPALFAGLLLALRLLVFRSLQLPGGRWRIIIPGLLLIVFFTTWAQEATPFFSWLYLAFPALGEWRFLGRMMAAASPWVALLAMLAFDDILRVIMHISSAWLRLTLIALLGAAAVVSAVDVMRNWSRAGGTEFATSPIYRPLSSLQRLYPNQFIAVRAWSFFDYLPFYDPLTRTTFGNPDYRPDSLSSTVSQPATMEFWPEFSIAFERSQQRYLAQNGYQPVAGIPEAYRRYVWQNPNAPPYAFTIPHYDFMRYTTPLKRDQVTPVSAFVHNVDHIRVSLDNYQNRDVLVLTETAYPGWQVTVNGQPARLESVGGMIGVTLPFKTADEITPIQVVFAYEPVWLYRGGWITLVSVLLTCGYLLRIERQLPRLRRYINPKRLSNP
jgi:hypothetical protein